MGSRLSRLLPLLTLFAMASAAARPAAGQLEGDLDPTFYFDGKFELDPIGGHHTLHDVVVAPDGRIVVAGHRASAGGQSTLFWAALDGESPPTICSPQTAGGGTAAARAAVFDGQGRLLLAGSADFGVVGLQGIVLRYLYPACDLDESFNLDGVFVTGYPSGARFEAAGVDSHQRVVLGGRLADYSRALAVRLTNNGLYDFGFDGDGHLELDLGESVVITSLVVQPDDRIVLAGAVDHPGEGVNFLALRLDPIGDLDSTFAGDGVAEVDFGLEYDQAEDLALDPEDGGLLLAGASGFSFSIAAVARLTAGGVLDTSFGGGDGRWTSSIGDDARLAAVEVQSDGKVLVAGDFELFGEDRDLLVYRLTPSGGLDLSFGFLGSTTIAFDLGSALDDLAGAASLHHGRLVVAGSAQDDPTRVGVVARLEIALLFADGFERGSTGGWSIAVP